MDSVKFSQANRRFLPPDGWNEEVDGPCGDLWAYQDDNSISSVWKPNAEELAALNDGGAIILTIIQSSQPPVSMRVARAVLEEETAQVEPSMPEIVDPVVNGASKLDEEDEHDTIEEVAAKNAIPING